MTMRLANPVPYEALVQMARHFRNIRKELGYNFTVTKADVGPLPKSVTNANVGSNRALYINIDGDSMENQEYLGKGATDITTWNSSVFLHVFMCPGHGDTPQLMRAMFLADFHEYFFDRGGEERWTLFNENKQRVARYLSVVRENTDLSYQSTSIFKVDVELVVNWAAVKNDLYYPR